MNKKNIDDLFEEAKSAFEDAYFVADMDADQAHKHAMGVCPYGREAIQIFANSEDLWFARIIMGPWYEDSIAELIRKHVSEALEELAKTYVSTPD